MSGIISNALYAKSDPKIKSLGNEPDNQEKLITSMETSETGISADRIAVLEKKTGEMDALVRGLIDEMLDFKAIAMTLSRQNGELRSLEIEREPVAPVTASPVPEHPSVSPCVAAQKECSTVIRPKDARQPDVPVAPAEPAMVRIMQSDGTMKMEIRRGDRNLRC